jgi:hypothetical protein
MAKDVDRYHWIIYHLEAIDYGDRKVEEKLSKLPSDFKLDQADPYALRRVISELKGILKWYRNYITYHQQKALTHIPETEKTKWAKERRGAENVSLEKIFTEADILPDKEVESKEFEEPTLE